MSTVDECSELRSVYRLKDRHRDQPHVGGGRHRQFIHDGCQLQTVLGIGNSNWYEDLTAHRLQQGKLGSGCPTVYDSPSNNKTISQMLMSDLKVGSSPGFHHSSPADVLLSRGYTQTDTRTDTPDSSLGWQKPLLGLSPSPISKDRSLSHPISLGVHSLVANGDDSVMSWTNSLATPPRDLSTNDELDKSMELSPTRDTARALFSPSSQLDITGESVQPLDSTFDEDDQSDITNYSNQSDLLNTSADNQAVSLESVPNSKEQNSSANVDVKCMDNWRANFKQRLLKKKTSSQTIIMNQKGTPIKEKINVKPIFNKRERQTQFNSPKTSLLSLKAQNSEIQSNISPTLDSPKHVSCTSPKLSQITSPTFSQTNSKRIKKTKSTSYVKDKDRRESSVTEALSDFFDPPSGSVGKRKQTSARKRKSSELDIYSVNDMGDSYSGCSTPSDKSGMLQSILSSNKKSRLSSNKKVRFSEKVDKRYVLTEHSSVMKKIIQKSKKATSPLVKKVRLEETVLSFSDHENKTDPTSSKEDTETNVSKSEQSDNSMQNIETKTVIQLTKQETSDYESKERQGLVLNKENGRLANQSKGHFVKTDNTKQKQQNSTALKETLCKTITIDIDAPQQIDTVTVRSDTCTTGDDYFSQISPTALNEMCGAADCSVETNTQLGTPKTVDVKDTNAKQNKTSAASRVYSNNKTCYGNKTETNRAPSAPVKRFFYPSKSQIATACPRKVFQFEETKGSKSGPGILASVCVTDILPNRGTEQELGDTKPATVTVQTETSVKVVKDLNHDSSVDVKYCTTAGCEKQHTNKNILEVGIAMNDKNMCIGFQSSSGTNISPSVDALRKASKLLTDVDSVVPGCTDTSHDTNQLTKPSMASANKIKETNTHVIPSYSGDNICTTSTSHQTFPLLTGFQSASGKHIQLDTDALDKAAKLLTEDSKATHVEKEIYSKQQSKFEGSGYINDKAHIAGHLPCNKSRPAQELDNLALSSQKMILDNLKKLDEQELLEGDLDFSEWCEDVCEEATEDMLQLDQINNMQVDEQRSENEKSKNLEIETVNISKQKVNESSDIVLHNKNMASSNNEVKNMVKNSLEGFESAHKTGTADSDEFELDHNAAPHCVGFSTASGLKISLKESSVVKAKSLLQDNLDSEININDETEQTKYPLPDESEKTLQTIGDINAESGSADVVCIEDQFEKSLKTVSSKKLSLSKSAKTPKSLNVIQGNNGFENAIVATCSTITDFKEKSLEASGGFRTASGGTVCLSEKRIKEAAKLFDESADSSEFQGFTSASDNKLNNERKVFDVSRNMLENTVNIKDTVTDTNNLCNLNEAPHVNILPTIEKCEVGNKTSSIAVKNEMSSIANQMKLDYENELKKDITCDISEELKALEKFKRSRFEKVEKCDDKPLTKTIPTKNPVPVSKRFPPGSNVPQGFRPFKAPKINKSLAKGSDLKYPESKSKDWECTPNNGVDNKGTNNQISISRKSEFINKKVEIVDKSPTIEKCSLSEKISNKDQLLSTSAIETRVEETMVEHECKELYPGLSQMFDDDMEPSQPCANQQSLGCVQQDIPLALHSTENNLTDVENIEKEEAPIVENIENSVRPIKFVGFASASGTAINLSNEALSKAKYLLNDNNESNVLALDTSNKAIRPSEFVGFTKASGTEINLPNDDLNIAKCLLNENSGGNTDSASDNTEKSNMPSKFVGFTKASGTKINLSNEALNKAKSLLIDNSENNDSTSENTEKSNMPSKFVGFTKASGTKMNLSNEALNKAKCLLIDNSENISNKVSSTEADNFANVEINDMSANLPGFLTASGKTFSLSKKSLMSASKLLEKNKTDVEKCKTLGFVKDDLAAVYTQMTTKPNALFPNSNEDLPENTDKRPVLSVVSKNNKMDTNTESNKTIVLNSNQNTKDTAKTKEDLNKGTNKSKPEKEIDQLVPYISSPNTEDRKLDKCNVNVDNKQLDVCLGTLMSTKKSDSGKSGDKSSNAMTGSKEIKVLLHDRDAELLELTESCLDTDVTIDDASPGVTCSNLENLPTMATNKQMEVAHKKQSLFQSASGKDVHVSENAIKIVKEHFSESELVAQTTETNVNPKILSECPSPDDKQDFKHSKITFVRELDKIPGCMFQTASGKNVAISDSALKKARECLKENEEDSKDDDIAVQAGMYTENESNETISTSNNNAGYIERNPDLLSGVFQTASGQKVGVSETALKEARKLVVEKESPTNSETVTVGKIDFSNMFQTASGKKVGFQENAINEARKLFSENNEDMTCHLDIKLINETKNKDFSEMFQTASGKKVGVSESALKAARKLIPEKESPELAETKSFQKQDFTEMFQTASGKKVVVTKTALKEARKQVLEKESTESSDINTNEKQDFSSMFQTASGKNVGIAENALNEARKLFTDKDDGCNPDINAPSNMANRFSNVFSTASGKNVTVSDKALQLAKQTLETSNNGPGTNAVSHQCLFQTASGKGVTVNEKSLKAAKEHLSHDEEITPYDLTNMTHSRDTKTQVKKEMKNSNYPKTTLPVVSNSSCSASPFQTASGEQVLITENALKKAKQQLEEKTADKEESSVTMRGNIFKTASGAGVNVSEKALNNSRERLAIKSNESLSMESGGLTMVAGHRDHSDLDTECSPHKRQKLDQNQEKAISTNEREQFIYKRKPLKSTPEGPTTDRRHPGYRPFIPVHCKQLYKPPARISDLTPNPVSVTPTKTSSNTKPAFHTPYKMTPPNLPAMSTTLAESMKDKSTVKQPVFIPRTKIGIQECKPDPKVEKVENNKHLKKIEQLNDETESNGKVVCNDSTTLNSEIFNKKISINLTEERTNKQNCVKEKFERNKINVESNVVSEDEKEKFQNLNKTPIPENDSMNALTNISSVAMATSDNEDDVALDDDLDVTMGDDLDLEDDSEEEKDVFYCRLVEARRQQGEIIERNGHKKTEPVRGRLYEQKQSGGRWKLREVIDRNIQTCQKAPKVTSKTAVDYKFDVSEHYGNYTVHVLVGDGAFLVPDDAGLAGKAEFYRAFLTMDGVEQKYINEAWLYNHYRWVVWKLAAYEVTSSSLAGRCLSPEMVMLQLKYRYDREIDIAQRSAIKKICERDDTPCKRLVLCVADIIYTDIAGDNTDTNKANIANKLDSKILLELTDGWYSLRTQIDVPLTDHVHKGRIYIGQKLCITGAELLGGEGACPPLEAPSSMMLKVSCNCTRPAPWDCALGYQCDPRPLCVPLLGLYGEGGCVGVVDVVIVRKYNTMYMEKLPGGGGCIFRTQKAEERTCQEFESRKQTEMEKYYNQIEKQMDLEEKQEKSSVKLLRKWTRSEIEGLSSGEDIHEAIRVARQPDSVQNYLSERQMSMLFDYQRQLQEEKQQNINTRFQNAWRDREEAVTDRNVTPVLKFRVAGCSHTDMDKHISTILTVWRPAAEVSDLQEGRRYKIYTLNTSMARSKHIGHDVQLTATKQTKFRAMVLDENFMDNIYEPREVLYVADLRRRQPVYGEFDFVGMVVKVTTVDTPTSRPCDTVYLADCQGNVLAVKVWNGFKSFGEDLFTVGSILCCSNLMDKCLYRSRFVPSVEATSEFSHITRNHQNTNQRKTVDKLNIVAKDKASFLTTAQHMLTDTLDRKTYGAVQPPQSRPAIKQPHSVPQAQPHDNIVSIDQSGDHITHTDQSGDAKQIIDQSGDSKPPMNQSEDSFVEACSDMNLNPKQNPQDNKEQKYNECKTSDLEEKILSTSDNKFTESKQISENIEQHGTILDKTPKCKTTNTGSKADTERLVPSLDDLPCTPSGSQSQKKSVYQSKMSKLLTYSSPASLSPLHTITPRSVTKGFKPPSFTKL